MNIEPRRYQQENIDEVFASWLEGVYRLILLSPTGSGKTVMAAIIIQRLLEMGKNVLMLVNRREIVEQMAETLTGMGIEYGVIMAGIEPNRAMPLQVGTMQTYSRRIDKGETHPADVIIPDEAHGWLNYTADKIIKTRPLAWICGLTATPVGPGGKGLGAIADKIVSNCDTQGLIDQGYLVKPVYYRLSAPDLDKIGKAMGDYAQGELGKASAKIKLVGDIVGNWESRASDRSTIVFAVNIKHATMLADQFADAGYVAEVISHHTKQNDRARIVTGVKSGAIQVLVNVNVACEGLDAPVVSCIVLARATKSVQRYLQMVGRGLRISPGKKDCLIFDHGGNWNEHGAAEDPREWKLDVDDFSCAKIENKEKKEKVLRPCDACGLAHDGIECPECFTRRRDGGLDVAWVDGQLEKAGKSATKKQEAEHRRYEKQEFYRMLMTRRKKRNFKPGFIKAAFYERFNAWAPKAWAMLTPMDESKEFKSYMNKKARAYRRDKDAKAKLSGRRV